MSGKSRIVGVGVRGSIVVVESVCEKAFRRSFCFLDGLSTLLC